MKKNLALFLLITLVFLAGCLGGEEKPEATKTTIETTTTRQETTAVTKTVEVTTTGRQTTTVGAPSTKVGPSYGTTSTSQAESTTSTVQPSSTTLMDFCASDSDCPKMFNSSRYCWEKGGGWSGDVNNIYMDEVEYVCSGKGTPTAKCVEVHKRMVVDRCKTTNCFNGVCYPTHCFNHHIDETEESIDCGVECPDCSLKPKITCFNDCDCLSRESQLYGRYYRSCELDQITASEFVTEGRCYDYTIYQNLVSYKCLKPGTINSYCTSKFTQQMITASCRNKNCTLDCRFKTSVYPNLAVINNRNVSFTSIE